MDSGLVYESIRDEIIDSDVGDDQFAAVEVLPQSASSADPLWEKIKKILQSRERRRLACELEGSNSNDGVDSSDAKDSEDVEKPEDGLRCDFCRRGLSSRPNELLGIYSFREVVELLAGNSTSTCAYSTVTSFDIMHFECQETLKMAGYENPWEWVALKNKESPFPCNSLFPIRVPWIELTKYGHYFDQYWDKLNAIESADGSHVADGSRLRLLTLDIAKMLDRFAKGDVRESNCRFLPFMIQMARYILERGSPAHCLVISQPAEGTEEDLQFKMVNSILFESYESWLQHRRYFLQCGIYRAYSQRGPASEADSANEALKIIRPMLVYTGLIEQLQRFLKVS